uniref:Protein kinase domain-containing protein n=1 Tax=Salix viminalis TaxID=40686 RepID=A0A6N2MZT2_SALVM
MRELWLLAKWGVERSRGILSVIPDKGTGCLTWYGELVDAVRYNMSDRYDRYVRVDALELNARKSNEYLEKEIPAILIPTISLALLAISIVAYFWRKRRGNRGTWVKNELQRSSSDQDLAFCKLSAATINFSPDNKLGQGGFGSVYKGELPDSEKIVVKRPSKNSKQGIEEFTNEVKHRNLVRLVGCCIQGGEQMLIYEYMPNKSLDSFLSNETRKLFLDWSKRFHFFVGIARGILYLHQDQEMTPKNSDFGIARIFKSDQTLDNTKRVVGTFGYMSPAYAVFGKFSLKSDVFSFGVMLLEIVSGKKNNEFNPQNPAQTLIGLVLGVWKEDRALEIVDSSL